MLTGEAPKRLSALVPALTYTLEWKRITLEPGLVYYGTRGESLSPPTGEASLDATLTFGQLQLVSSNYLDVIHTPGAYFGTVGAAWARKVGRRWSFKARGEIAAANAAYNAVYFDTRVAKLDVAGVGANVQLDLNDVFYIALHSEASALLANSLAVGRQKTLANVGLTLGGELGL